MSTIESDAHMYALDVIHNWPASPELEDYINSDAGRELENLVAIAFERLADQIKEDQAAEHRALVAERDAATDLLAKMFAAYENGDPVYEDPEDLDGFVGYAVRLDDESFNAVADLLNRLRPVAALA